MVTGTKGKLACAGLVFLAQLADFQARSLSPAGGRGSGRAVLLEKHCLLSPKEFLSFTVAALGPTEIWKFSLLVLLK